MPRSNHPNASAPDWLLAEEPARQAPALCHHHAQRKTHPLDVDELLFCARNDALIWALNDDSDTLNGGLAMEHAYTFIFEG